VFKNGFLERSISQSRSWRLGFQHD